MVLHSVQTADFRNLQDQEIVFAPGMNRFFGNNGQGKTNWLEALHFLCIGRSHRPGVRDRDAVAFGKDFFLLRGSGRRGASEMEIRLSVRRNGEKTIHRNDQPLKKASDFWGTLNVVSFSPEDIQIARSDPSTRRLFLDMLLAQTSAHYLHQLKQYRHFLLQRNALLRSGREDAALLDTYTETLIPLAASLIHHRKKALDFLSGATAALLEKLAGPFGPFRMEYAPSHGGPPDQDPAEALERAFAENRLREKAVGMTLAGPHRDEIRLFLGDSLVRTYGSQGQCRALVLALKLAAVEYIRHATGEDPILLMDDIFSELDPARKESLRSVLPAGLQCFLASPQIDFSIGPCRSFAVQSGAAIEVDG